MVYLVTGLLLLGLLVFVGLSFMKRNFPKWPKFIPTVSPSSQLQSPQKPEPFHWRMAIATVSCVMIGFFGLGSKNEFGIILGLAIICFAVAGAVLTRLWTRVDGLSAGRKIIVWVPVIAGGIVYVMLGLIVHDIDIFNFFGTRSWNPFSEPENGTAKRTGKDRR